MNDFYNNKVREFLEQTKEIYDKKQELPIQQIKEHYKKISNNLKIVNKNISKINIEFRVELCRYIDKFLDIIIDCDGLENNLNVKNVYTPHHIGGENQALLKDKGIAGYLLAKELGAKPLLMFGLKNREYTNLGILEGLELLKVDEQEGINSKYFNYLKEHYKNIDVLILHGFYSFTLLFLNEYRQLRPDGKVYCGLDMNINWMNKINWNHPDGKRFMEQYDVITTSSSYVRDVININRDIPFYCRYIPNGFYNVMNNDIIADATKKENIILTVGRIGTEQKNNTELLLAFAKVEHILKNWSVHLVGNIETVFLEFIDKYFIVYPELKERVIFKGDLNNKDELYSEYAKAKCFALTSIVEGGTPNVYAEALFHGCMFITSDIDAANEITNNGELGEVYKRKDIDALAECMLRMASKSSEEEMKIHIQKALDYGNKVYDWNRNAKKIAYMLSE